MNTIRTDSPLQHHEVHEVVARAILAMAADTSQGQYIDIPALVNPESCVVRLGLSGNDRQAFARVNRESFSPIANSFVNRLITANVVERDWTANPNLYRLNPELTHSLETITTPDGFTTLEFVETIKDSELRSRCGATVLQNVYADSLLREAVTVLEDRLRGLLSETGRIDRRNVPALVLHPDSGSNPVGKERAKQDDFFLMVKGLLGLYGTEVHHELLPEIDAGSVRRVIGMIDEILAKLSEQNQ